MGQSYASFEENVSQAFGSPLSSPRLNQASRCADVPCVNDPAMDGAITPSR